MTDTKKAAEPTDEQIIAVVHKACGLGRVSLTHINNDGEEVPTDVARCFARAIAALPAVQVPPIPPNHWDEWAMKRSREIVQEMEDANHPRAQLVARIHCLLIDAMQYAAPTQGDSK